MLYKWPKESIHPNPEYRSKTDASKDKTTLPGKCFPIAISLRGKEYASKTDLHHVETRKELIYS